MIPPRAANPAQTRPPAGQTPPARDHKNPDRTGSVPAPAPCVHNGAMAQLPESAPAPGSTAALLAGYLHAAGVRHVFGYPGESVIDFMEAVTHPRRPRSRSDEDASLPSRESAFWSISRPPFVVAIVGMITGLVLFGSHGVTLLSGHTVSFGNGPLRAMGIAGYVCIDLIGLAAIGLFFSTLTEVPVGAMAATVVSAIACAVLDHVPQLGVVRDFPLDALRAELP